MISANRSSETGISPGVLAVENALAGVLSLLGNRVLVVTVSLETEVEFETHMAHCLSSDEIERGDRFLFPSDRKSFVAAHTLKRLVLGVATQSPARQLAFLNDALGKPQLAGSKLEFNISHARGLVVVALSSGESVGVDAESIDNVREGECESLCQLVLSDLETTIVRHSADPARAFIHYWTAKEAVSKAAGMGLTMPFKDILIKKNYATTADGHWCLRYNLPTYTHIVAVAWQVTVRDAGSEPVFFVVEEKDLWMWAQRNGPSRPS